MNPLHNYQSLYHEDTEVEDTQRWLLPYADLITLLFAVFVVMYAISNVHESKLKSLSESLAIALNTQITKSEKKVSREPEIVIKQDPVTDSQPSLEKDAPQELAVKMNQQSDFSESFSMNLNEDLTEDFTKNLTKNLNEDLNLDPNKDPNLLKMEEALKAELSDFIAQDKVKIIRQADWMSVEINDSLIFKSGQADLAPSFANELKYLSTIFMKYNNTIQVEGHTDNLKLKGTGAFPSNWELSAARASSVVRCLIENGIASSRLEVVGLADNHPIASNDTALGRYHNRRVTLKILAQYKSST